MINQINFSSADKNVFAPLQSNDVTYAITKPFTDTQKLEAENEKEKKSNNLGYNIAAIALMAGFGVFLLTKGFSKKSSFKIDKISKFLEDKAAKLSENKNLTNVQNFYLSTLKSAKSLLNKSKAIFTFATLKDILFQKAFALTPTLKKTRDFLTKWYEKVSVRTTKKSYSKTLIKFESLYGNFAEANRKIPKAQTDILEKKIQNVRTNYFNAFSEDARNQRYIQYKNDMEGIDELVWNKTYKDIKGFIKNPDTYTKFLAEELAAPAKFKLNNTVSKLKNKITISRHDNYIVTKGLVNNIDRFIDPTDRESRILMRNLRTHLESYRKTLEDGVGRGFPNSDVAKDLKELNSYISQSGKYDKETVKHASESINNLTRVLSEDKQGEIQEIMEIYKQHLSYADYEKLKKSVHKALSSLDHSVDLETDKLFDKVRDLQLGSAPHDTLAILSSFGLIGWGLSKAENSDERTSVALKFGIPALAGILTTIWCTMSLIASGPSLLIGLASTIPINMLGEAIDNMRKKYKEQKTPNLTLPIIQSPSKILQAINENRST